MLNGARRIAPRMHLPLGRLALCLDCDECFETTDACPACGSETWTSLARFLEWGRAESLAWVMGNVETRAQHLIVVARDRMPLYQRLQRVLAGTPEFQVVLDRRRAERRQATVSPVRERRRRGRRAPDSVAEAPLSARIIDL